ncbi:hypothetical protein ABK040_005457 [Willaertia magna]
MSCKVKITAILFAIISLCLFIDFSNQRQPNNSVWNNLDEIIKKGITLKAYPGATILIGDRKGIVYTNAYGYFTYNETNNQPMHIKTKFDMASCSKVLAATSATAILYQKGLLNIKQKVVEYFPDFKQNGKGGITIENLLLHNSGFPPDPSPGYSEQAFGCPATSQYHPPQVFTCISKIYDSWLSQTLQNPIGKEYVYSDLSMISIMFIVGKIAKDRKLISVSDLRKDCLEQGGGIDGKGIEVCYYEAFVRRYVLENLDMNDSEFVPKTEERASIPPAWVDNSYRHELIQGVVSDENCYATGGISGHAGLFSNVIDVQKMMDELMFRRKGNFLNQTTYELFITVKNGTQSSRALGWDTNYEGNGSCGSLSKKTFLHLGYTGTQVCGDPEREIYTIFLTNRVYPDKLNNQVAYYRNAVNSEVQKVYDQYFKSMKKRL